MGVVYWKTVKSKRGHVSTHLLYTSLICAVSATLFLVSTPTVAHATLKDCRVQTTPKVSKGKWQKKRSKLISKLGKPRHEAVDVIVITNQKTRLAAKFQYGRVRKDLQGEVVELWRSTCDGKLQSLGRAETSSDGWLSHLINAPKLPGRYTLFYRVRGDHSMTTATLWVVPKGQKVAIFDLDGTLTVSDKEVQKQAATALLSTGKSPHVPKAYPAAKQVTAAYAKQGVLPIYLSGRPYWFGHWTRQWLGKGYSPGPVILTRKHRQVAPTNQGVGQFKFVQLQKLKQLGLTIVAAHGNATTDIFAYQKAKVAQVYIIGPHGGQKKTQRISGSWQSLVDQLIKRAAKDR